MDPTDAKPLVFEMSNASTRSSDSSPKSDAISLSAPIVLPSSRRIFSRSWESTSSAFFCASSTSFSFFPLCGTERVTFAPRLSLSHSASTSWSSAGSGSMISLGMYGVPA